MIARALFAALLLAAPLQSLDDAARTAVQGTRRPWLEPAMRFASDAGRPAMLGGAVVALLSGAAGRAVLAEAVVVLVPVNLVVEVLKRATDRTRPDGTHARSNAAFPSSHTANAFAVAFLLARRWRRSAVPVFAFAAWVGFSRLYLDRHWLTDVAAGAAIGGLVAWGAVSAWRRFRATRPGSSPSS